MNSAPLTTGLLTRRVRPGQRGIAYHYEVLSMTTGMRHPAFDLQDAHDLADELCLATCGAARILKPRTDGTDEIVGFRHYFHVSKAASAAYASAMAREALDSGARMH